MKKSVKQRILLACGLVGLLALLQIPVHVIAWWMQPDPGQPAASGGVETVAGLEHTLLEVQADLDSLAEGDWSGEQLAAGVERLNTANQHIAGALETLAGELSEAPEQVDDLAQRFEQLLQTGAKTLNRQSIPDSLPSLTEQTDAISNRLTLLKDTLPESGADGGLPVDRSLILMIVGILLALAAAVAALVVGMLLGKNVSEPLLRIREFVDELIEGKRDTEAEVMRLDEIGEVADSLHTLRDKLAGWEKAVRKELTAHEQLAGEMTRVAEAVLDGELSAQVQFEQAQGVYRDMVEVWNSALTSAHSSVTRTSSILETLAKGQRPSLIQDELPGDFEALKEGTNHLARAIQGYLDHVGGVLDSAKSGELNRSWDDPGLGGMWATAAGEMTDIFAAQGRRLEMITGRINRLAVGEIPRELGGDFPGQWEEARKALQQMIYILDALVGESMLLVQQVVQGDLDTRADVDRFQGDFRNVLNGFNRALDSFATPNKEIREVLEKMSRGDLSVNVEGDFSGDHAEIANALNRTIRFSRRVLNQIGQASREVAATAGQLADTSQSLSQGATDQASSLQEVSVTLTEISQQTKKNSDSAVQANSLVQETTQNADRGNQHMSKMMTSMNEISKATRSISKIIRVIDDIAFQTNLLALNAAVEAAHAGKHGKGFAVVADEVRNLAQRSADAASETSQMIENTIRSVQSGTLVATQTADVLGQIVDKVALVNERIADITRSSQDQAASIDQVKETLYSIEGVTQATVESAQIAAASSEELSSQAEDLRATFKNFQLSRGDGKKTKKGEKSTQKQLAGKRTATEEENVSNTETGPRDEVNMDDEDMGVF